VQITGLQTFYRADNGTMSPGIALLSPFSARRIPGRPLICTIEAIFAPLASYGLSFV
jgi:hypothetical protein